MSRLALSPNPNVSTCTTEGLTWSESDCTDWLKTWSGSFFNTLAESADCAGRSVCAIATKAVTASIKTDTVQKIRDLLIDFDSPAIF
jgi:hypothetical protein